MNIAKVTRRQRMQEPAEKLLECMNAQLPPRHSLLHSHLSSDGDIMEAIALLFFVTHIYKGAAAGRGYEILG